jgi:hypothetical protein
VLRYRGQAHDGRCIAIHAALVDIRNGTNMVYPERDMVAVARRTDIGTTNGFPKQRLAAVASRATISGIPKTLLVQTRERPTSLNCSDMEPNSAYPSPMGSSVVAMAAATASNRPSL